MKDGGFSCQSICASGVKDVGFSCQSICASGVKDVRFSCQSICASGVKDVGHPCQRMVKSPAIHSRANSSAREGAMVLMWTFKLI